MKIKEDAKKKANDNIEKIFAEAEKIGNTFPVAQNLIIVAAQKISDLINDLFTRLVDYIVKIVSDIIVWIKGAWDSIVSTFNNIKTNVKYIDNYSNKEYSLNINKYKEEQKKMKEMYKKFDELNKLPDALSFNNLFSDTAKINSSVDKVEKNKQWIKVRSSDIYIDESVKVIDKLIEQNSFLTPVNK
jgi:cell shape-determining protein MreC